MTIDDCRFDLEQYVSNPSDTEEAKELDRAYGRWQFAEEARRAWVQFTTAALPEYGGVRNDATDVADALFDEYIARFAPKAVPDGK